MEQPQSPRRSSLRLSNSPRSSPTKSSPASRRTSSMSTATRNALAELNSKPPTPSVKTNAKDKTKKPRKSLGRRVSFAATAHVRLFDKDAEGWAPKNEMDDELNKALEMFPVNQNQPMDFQMPDLSSVRRNSETFNLRLSLPAAPSSPQDKSMSLESDSHHEQSSFEISIKGSPLSGTSNQSNVDMSLLESPHSVVAPSEEQHAKKDGRRDTIANFFSSAQSSPNLLSEKGATFSLLAPEMTEDLTVDMELSSPLAIRGHQQDLSGGASKLPSLSPISKAGRRSSMRKRDSIACFFESPKYHTVVSTEEEQPELDEEADADMEIDVLSPVNTERISILNSLYATREEQKENEVFYTPSARRVDHASKPAEQDFTVNSGFEDQSMEISIADVTSIHNIELTGSMMVSPSPFTSAEPESPISSPDEKTSPSPKPTKGNNKGRRYSIAPSPKSAKSSSNDTPKARLVKAMSSPYTPRVRSKLSQCLTADRSLSESSSDISDEGPMTQSDMTLSQNTFQATQEPLACNEDEIFDSLVNTEAAPTLNRVVDVSRFETESNRDEQEGEDNLMDEELSMVDNSFSQEEATASVPPPTTTEILAPLEQITTLEEFMKATGTQYMAEVPTSFRRETNAFALDAATPTHADYAKAASVWFPELEIYEFGCKELSQYIEEGSATQKEREAEIAASTPIIFYEVIEGTDEEKKDLIDNLKATKTFTRLETQEAWYTWREKLLGPLDEALTDNIGRLRRDERYATQFEEQFDAIIEESSLYREELRAIITDLRKKNIDDANERDSTLAKLREEDEEQRCQYEEMQKTLEALKAQVAVEVLNEEAMTIEENNIKEAIQNAQETCNDLILFDPQDLTNLKEEFKLLFLTHRWAPVDISTSKITLLYDTAVKLTFDLTGDAFYGKLSLDQTGAPELLNFSSIPAKSEDSAVVQFWAPEVLNRYFITIQKSFELCYTIPDFQKVMHKVTEAWEKLKTLTHDIQMTREHCLIRLEPMSNRSSLPPVKATFFSYIQKRRFEVLFWFSDNNGQLSYKWTWTFKNIYGDMTEFQVSKAVRGIKEGQKLMDLCQVLASLVNASMPSERAVAGEETLESL